jgi:hypothetical protein
MNIAKNGIQGMTDTRTKTINRCLPDKTTTTCDEIWAYKPGSHEYRKRAYL